MSQASPEAAATLQRLEGAAAQAAGLRASIKDRAIIQELSRAEHALIRRLDVWKQVRAIEAAGPAESPLPAFDPHVLRSCVAEIERCGQCARAASVGEIFRFAGVAELGCPTQCDSTARAASVGVGDIEAIE